MASAGERANGNRTSWISMLNSMWTAYHWKWLKTVTQQMKRQRVFFLQVVTSWRIQSWRLKSSHHYSWVVLNNSIKFQTHLDIVCVPTDDTTDTSGIRQEPSFSKRVTEECGVWITHQRMFLPGRKVQRSVIQTFHEVPQTRYINLVLNTLEETQYKNILSLHPYNFLTRQKLYINSFQPFSEDWGLTAATGTNISTKSPARECLMSLSFTSKKYWAHSLKRESTRPINQTAHTQNTRS